LGSRRTQIIILNGVGSVGKSSIAKALQGITGSRFLHVEMDAFLDMLPESSWGAPEGITFETIEEQGLPAVVIKTGALGERLMRGMRGAIAAMAAERNDMIVDEVMEAPAKDDYARRLADFDAAFVGVFAPLPVLEAREKARGDRMIGLARRQFERIHRVIAYDLEIDTRTATSLECARRIKDRFAL
jgi:chloramphenicol 3-O phosphotransferase